MPPRNLVLVFGVALVSLACYHKATRNRYAESLAEAMNIVATSYIEEVPPHELFANAMNGMVSNLDPYSSFVTSDSYRDLEENLSQEFGGVGIIVERSKTTKRLTVLSPLVGTPAYKAGLQSGDVILEIDGQSTKDMSLGKSVKLMRGLAGSTVKLRVLRPGSDEPKEYVLERAVIPIESVMGDRRQPDGSWQFWLEEDSRIGYVRITNFGQHTAEELKRTLAFAQHPVQALILDVRGNAGGLLSAGVEVCELFLDPGAVIVTTRGRNGLVRHAYHSEKKPTVDPKLPIVILTNKFSASATEIVAACLQDHGRATVIGERTWGKGTVQHIISMESGKSALKLTTASYWRPSERNIHRGRNAKDEDDWGVRPNEGFEVKLTEDQQERVADQRRHRDVLPTGTPPEEKPTEPFDDPQLRRAIEFLRERL